MSKKWETYEEEFLKKHLTEDPKEVHLLFSEKYGLTRSLESVRKKMARLREEITQGSLQDTIADWQEEDPEFEIDEDTVKELKQEFLEENTEINSPLQLLDPSIVKQQMSLWLREISKIESDKNFQPFRVISNNKSLVLVISDVHLGKQTKDFNLEVAVERLLSITDRLLERQLPSFDEIRLIILGDLVEGEGIFAHQANLIEAPAITAHKIGTETLWTLALDLNSIFEVPVVIDMGPGNHGSVSKTAHPATNWDNAIGQSLYMISKFANNNHIKVNLNLKEFNLIEVKNSRLLLNHRGLKHLGTPAMIQKMGGWSLSKDMDILVHGHWHNMGLDTYLGRTRICNGNVAGPDDLGEIIAREDPPCQVYFFIDPARPGQVCNFDFIGW